MIDFLKLLLTRIKDNQSAIVTVLITIIIVGGICGYSLVHIFEIKKEELSSITNTYHTKLNRLEYELESTNSTYKERIDSLTSEYNNYKDQLDKRFILINDEISLIGASTNQMLSTIKTNLPEIQNILDRPKLNQTNILACVNLIEDIEEDGDHVIRRIDSGTEIIDIYKTKPGQIKVFTFGGKCKVFFYGTIILLIICAVLLIYLIKYKVKNISYKTDFESLDNLFKGITALSKDENKNAEIAFNKSILLNPKNSFTFISRGLLYETMNRNEDAEKDFNKAIELDPDNEYGYFNRGLLYEIMNRNEDAEKDFNKAIELAPNDAFCYFNRGILYERMDYKEKAIKDFNKAVKLEISSSNCYLKNGILNEIFNQNINMKSKN